jgi:hypothetical protein
MGVHFHECEEYLAVAVEELFSADAQIQAVGIARHGHAFGFKAVKNGAGIVPASAVKGAKKTPKSIKKIPVMIETVTNDVEPHARVPHPMATSFIPERRMQRPLVCGLQVQNVDDDNRQRKAGKLDANSIVVGTLGCFVRLSGGTTAILSNNHVLAGENRGLKGKDRILQPGGVTFTSGQQVATLSDFVPLEPSPPSARPAKGNVIYNAVDAAVATVANGAQLTQGFLPARSLAGPHGTTAPKVGDQVLKVGRSTGLTHGTITAVGIVVGPIPYDPGNCWFNQQFEIVGNQGVLFSDHGDSGSAIASTTGELVGLLYAGNGTQTYACAIDSVFSAFGCTLA